MHDLNHTRRFAAILLAGCATLTLAGAAHAVDLRDWGKKYATSERFVVLAQFNNEAVLDKETQLVWQAVPAKTTDETWIAAYGRCLTHTGGSRRGWRLPTYVELASLVGGFSSMPPAFSGVPSGMYWSATRFPINVDYAYSLLVPGAGIASPQISTSSAKTWCVRGPV